MRWFFLFMLGVLIPLMFQIMSSRQQSDTTTVDTPEKILRPLPLRPQTTEVTPKANAPHPLISAKKQPQKVIAQKHPLKAKPESSKNKAATRPYTAPAIEIRVRIAHFVSKFAIASSTVANILDGNGQVLERLLPSQSFQVSAHNSAILFQN